jgi:hypothetical protein
MAAGPVHPGGWARARYPTFARALAFETQVEACLLLVVPCAQSVEIPQRGRPALLDWHVVVELEVPADVAALDDAFALELLDGGAQAGRDRSAEV